MDSISFHGAAGTVTGSCFLLHSSKKILIDCGLFQGSSGLSALNAAPFGFEPKVVDALLLTHAHLDHCGRIPKLVKEGFLGPIYATSATIDLLEITLHDAAKVMAENEDLPIYSEEDVEKTLSLCKIVDYNKPFKVFENEVTYINAGHILGSASIVFDSGEYTFAFSGDLGNTPQDIIKPTEYVDRAQFVIMESTYGDKNHPDEDPANTILKEINEVEKTGGTLLIPAFSLERTQEILHKIDHLKSKRLVNPQTMVFLDSPMATRANQVFRKYSSLYNTETAAHAKADDPFSFEGLNVIYKNRDSESIKEILGPKVIIAGSGMMTGGRIVTHALHFLPIPSTQLLIVGYQGEDTLGRHLLDGNKIVKVKDTQISVKAHITDTQAMSSHAGQSELLNWISKIQEVKKLFLVHGENGPRNVLAKKILDSHNFEVVEPQLHSTSTI